MDNSQTCSNSRSARRILVKSGLSLPGCCLERSRTIQSTSDTVPKYPKYSGELSISADVSLMDIGPTSAFCRANYKLRTTQTIAIRTPSTTSSNMLSFHASQLTFSSPISCNAKNALSHIKTGSISPKKALNKTPGTLPWGCENFIRQSGQSTSTR